MEESPGNPKMGVEPTKVGICWDIHMHHVCVNISVNDNLDVFTQKMAACISFGGRKKICENDD